MVCMLLIDVLDLAVIANCEKNAFTLYVGSEGPDQTVHYCALCSLIRAFIYLLQNQ